MREHHRRAIDVLSKKLSGDPTVLALIIGGSVAKGYAREASDVDCYIVVPDDQFSERLSARDTHYMDRDVCDYEGGYVDGKYISLDWMKKCAKVGNEPTRWSFCDAEVEFSRADNLQDLIDEIARYPKDEKEERIRKLTIQFHVHAWFTREAVQREDRYFLSYSANNLVLFGGRMILVLNEMLYPCPKWFMHELANAPRKPDGFMKSIDAALDSPSKETLTHLAELVLGFAHWPDISRKWPAEFMLANEWSWMFGGVHASEM